MNTRFFSSGNINYFSLIVYFTGMFFGLPYSSYAIVLFLFIQLYLLIKEGVRPFNAINKAFFIPLLFYALLVISMVYSANKSAGYFDLQVKLSFLLFPLFFGLKKDENQVSMDKIARIFIIITGVASLGYLIKAAILYYSTGIIPLYMSFAHPLHPSYLSLYIVVNLMFVFHEIIRSRKLHWISLVSSLSGLLVLYYSESKAGMITVVALFSFLLFKLFYQKSKIISLVIVVGFFMGILSLFLLNQRFKYLIVAGLHIEKVFDHPEQVWESTALRILAWDASLDLIKENPVFGVGGGDVGDELVKVYRQKNYRKPMEMRMNSHNQFLETTVGQGFIGLFILLAFLLVLLYRPRFPFLSQAFLLIITLNMLFESMFNKQAGVVFILVIYSLLFVAKKDELPSWSQE